MKKRYTVIFGVLSYVVVTTTYNVYVNGGALNYNSIPLTYILPAILAILITIMFAIFLDT